MRELSKLLLVVLSIFIAAGFYACKSKTETYESDEGKVEIDREGEKANITIQTEEGETFNMTVNRGELPGGWPSEIPVIPGGNIMFSQTGTQSNVQQISVEADETMAGALEFYRNKLNAGGWNIENTMTMPQMNMVSAEKSDRELMLQIMEADGKTQVQIIIRKK